MGIYYVLLLTFTLSVPALILNFWFIKKRKEKGMRYHEFVRKFYKAEKNQNYPDMVKYGRAVLYNYEITNTDLIKIEIIVKKHALNYPELAELELEIFQKRTHWDSRDDYHKQISRF